jgi:hypothetical protein
MYVNGSLQDQVFMSDGNWGVDYNTATSSVKNFKIINNTSPVVDNKDDFLLFRNVRVEANSPDYITLYKMLRGGGAKQDLTAFKTLQFSASGSGAVMKVVLLKAGITNWADQYTIEIPLTAAKKDYQLSLNDFVSAGSNVKIHPNDLTAIIFSLPVSSGKMTAVSADISSVLFSKVDYAYVNSLNSKEIITYPNPSSGKFNVNFKSAVSNELRVFITEVTTGRVVYSKQVWAQIGENSVPVIINNVKGLSNYIISVEGAGQRYTPKAIIIDQH